MDCCRFRSRDPLGPALGPPLGPRLPLPFLALTKIQIWPLGLAFFSSKEGHNTLRDENSQSSMVMVLLFRLPNVGFLRVLNCQSAEREKGEVGVGLGNGER